MALIKCPDCGKEFSENASTCPQCGYKKRNDEIKKQLNQNKNFFKKYWWIFVIIGLLAGLRTFFQEFM